MVLGHQQAKYWQQSYDISSGYQLFGIHFQRSQDIIPVGQRDLAQGCVTANVNLLRPRDAYMRQWSGPSLIQIIACRLLGAKPLFELMLTYSQLNHKEQNSVKS